VQQAPERVVVRQRGPGHGHRAGLRARHVHAQGHDDGPPLRQDDQVLGQVARRHPGVLAGGSEDRRGRHRDADAASAHAAGAVAGLRGAVQPEEEAIRRDHPGERRPCHLVEIVLAHHLQPSAAPDPLPEPRQLPHPPLVRPAATVQHQLPYPGELPAREQLAPTHGDLPVQPVVVEDAAEPHGLQEHLLGPGDGRGPAPERGRRELADQRAQVLDVLSAVVLKLLRWGPLAEATRVGQQVAGGDQGPVLAPVGVRRDVVLGEGRV